MKTQISKDGFRADRRYSGVYQQQGRLITDSDWNEMVDILKGRLDDALADVIGNGTPKARAAGLQVVGNTLKINPGVVYAGGVEAQIVPAPGVSTVPFGLHEQADFPLPAPPPAATAYRVYADVWDRSVVSLEDAELRDPALHGADTCTRSQTMAQVKWCPQAKDPENPADNPTRGNAPLTVAFAEGGNVGDLDPCDPQTPEVDPVGGDFLLRVEVHDVRWPTNAGPAAPDRVVVKWSRENGAEQYPFAEMPDWFKTGPWLYETYDTLAEKHLGFHLPGNQAWTPQRGKLVAELPQAPPPNTLVRRWDGYAVAAFAGSWGTSGDAADDPDTTAPGAEVKVSGGNLTVELGDLDLTLVLQGKVLLPGDAWLIPVRRAVFAEGIKLLDNAQPLGIRHRYVTLGEVLANGTLKAPTPAEKRRLAFPRLTDIGAADIAFPKPCNTSVYQGAAVQTVADALGLLCDVKAEQIKYANPQAPAVQEVKAGLDDLYTRVGQTGNRFLVGPGGYPTIEAALQDLGPQTNDIALALAPGEHSIKFGFNPGNLAGKHLSILGVGGGSRVLAEATVGLSGLASFALENVAMQLISGSQLLVGNCGEVVITGCRLGGSQTFGGLLGVSGVARLRFQGNWIDVPWHTTDSSLMAIIGTPNTLGMVDDIEDAFGVSHDRFLPYSSQIAQHVADLTSAQRKSIRTSIESALQQISVSKEEQLAYTALANNIPNNAPNINFLAGSLRNVRTVVHRKSPGTALFLGSPNEDALITDNQIVGLLGVYGGPDPAGVLSQNEQDLLVQRAQLSGKVVLTRTAAKLTVSRNQLTAIRCGSNLVAGIKTALANDTVINLTTYQNISVSDNFFAKGDSQLIAGHVNLDGNTFGRVGEHVGWTIGTGTVAMGNRAFTNDPNTMADFFTGVPLNMVQFLGNSMILLNP